MEVTRAQQMEVPVQRRADEGGGLVPELGVIWITHEVVEVGVKQRFARLRSLGMRLWVKWS